MNNNKTQEEKEESSLESSTLNNPKKEAKVEVTKEDLQALMRKIEDQSQTIEILLRASDKSRLAKAMTDGGKPLIKTVRVNYYDPVGKLVVGWKNTMNQSEIINGRWIEDQRTMLIFEDGSTLEVTLLDFYRKMSGVKTEVVSSVEKMDEKGNRTKILKVRFDDGRELDIAEVFIN